MREVITTSGHRISLADYEEKEGLLYGQLNSAFSIDDRVFCDMQTYAEPLLKVVGILAEMDQFKTICGYPKYEDTDLVYKYCDTEGLFTHLYYAGYRKLKFLRENVEKAIEEAGVQARVKFHVQHTSVMYIDVAPMYYAYGKPFAYLPHDEAWEMPSIDLTDSYRNYFREIWKRTSKYPPFLTKQEKEIYL